MAQGDEVGVLGVGKPFAASDELFAEETKVRDRTAEGGTAEFEKRSEHFGGATALCGGFHGESLLLGSHKVRGVNLHGDFGVDLGPGIPCNE